jgi:amino acid transporter
VALLNSTVLTTTRMPFALAEDGYLPPFLTRKHSRYGTPWVAILISAAIYAALAQNTLGKLISIYVWLRAATTVITVLSVWGLRRKRPDLARPFRVPAGRLGLVYVIALPVVMTMIALRFSDPDALRWGPWALLLGPVVYGAVKIFAKRQSL